jgi:hypothetical protein
MAFQSLLLFKASIVNMSAPSAKRLNDADSAPDGSLQKAIETFSADFNYANGLASALTNPTLKPLLQGLRLAHYKASLNSECSHYTPTEFRSFKIVRDRVGKIISIEDDKSKLDGLNLQTVLALEAARAHGSEFTILEVGTTDVEGLLVPKALEIIPFADDAKSKKGSEEAMLYTLKGRCIIHLTSKDVKDVLSLPQATLSQTVSLLTAYDKVKEVDKSMTVSQENFSNLTHLRGLLQDVNVKERQRVFYSKLLSLQVLKLSIDKRVDEFVVAPSLDFAQSLKLGLHHQGDLFSKSSQKKVGWKPLKDIDDQDTIVMSTVSIDARGYSTLPKAEACRVIPWTDDLVVKSGNKFREVGSIYKMKASTYKKFLEAAYQDNTSKKRVTPQADNADQDSSGKVAVAFNL